MARIEIRGGRPVRALTDSGKVLADATKRKRKPGSRKKTIVGYQIESRDGKQNIPEGQYSFCIYNLAFVHEWFAADPGRVREWCIIPIFDGDVEEPTFVK